MHDQIFISEGESMIQLPLNKVVYFTSTEQGCVAILASKKQIAINASLDNIEAILPDLFHRIHESFIINEEKIDCFTKTQMELKGGYKLPMTQKGFDNLTEGKLVFDGFCVDDADTCSKSAESNLGGNSKIFSEN